MCGEDAIVTCHVNFSIDWNLDFVIQYIGFTRYIIVRDIGSFSYWIKMKQ